MCHNSSLWRVGALPGFFQKFRPFGVGMALFKNIPDIFVADLKAAEFTMLLGFVHWLPFAT